MMSSTTIIGGPTASSSSSPSPTLSFNASTSALHKRSHSFSPPGSFGALGASSAVHSRPSNQSKAKRPRNITNSCVFFPSNVKAAIRQFQEVTSQEVSRMVSSSSCDPDMAINQLISKMVMKDVWDIKAGEKLFSQRDLEFVMESSQLNELGATRAMHLRAELRRLRLKGISPHDSILLLLHRIKPSSSSPSSSSSSLPPISSSSSTIFPPEDDKLHRKRKHADEELSLISDLEVSSFSDQEPPDSHSKRRRDMIAHSPSSSSSSPATQHLVNSQFSMNNLPSTSTTTTTTTINFNNPSNSNDIDPASEDHDAELDYKSDDDDDDDGDEDFY